MSRSEAGFFVRAEYGTSTSAYLICGANEDGTFSGVFAYCGADQEGEIICSRTFERVFTPFGRIEGEDERDGLKLVAEINQTDGVSWDTTYVSNVEYDDGLVFLGVENEGLRIFDVADRENPVEVGFVPRLVINDIKPFRVGGRRYVALADEDSAIVDVTNPRAPTIVGSLGGYTHRIELDVSPAGEPRLYYGGDQVVHIISLLDPSSPKLLLTTPLPMGQFGGRVHALTVKDEVLYVAGGYSGFHIISPFEPEGPVLHGSFVDEFPYSHHAGVFSVGEKTYALHNDEIGTNPWFKTVDVTLGANTFLNVLAEYKTRDFIASHNIDMVGTRAYVAYYQDGVRVLDASDPSELKLVAYYNTWNATTAPHATFEGAIDVDVDPESGTIYVADSPRGLLVMRQTGIVP